MPEMVKNLMADLDNKKFTDCTFVFNDNETEKTFAAHKAILASVSPVFEAGFYGDLKDDGPIKVEDVTFEVFQKMIWVIYDKTVKIESSEEACQLYYAAQKYDLSEPLAIARTYMLTNISTTTAPEFHNATVLFHDTEITQKCCSTLFEKTFDTTKIEGFFDSTDPLQGVDTFKLEQSEDGEVLKKSIAEFKEKLEKENSLDMEGFIVKTFELIRILTSETKKAFELIVPESKAKFACSLNWIPPTGTMEAFNTTCNEQIFPSFFEMCSNGHDCAEVRVYECSDCVANANYCYVTSIDYPDTFKNISKYGSKGVSAYILKDLKVMYDELKVLRT